MMLLLACCLQCTVYDGLEFETPSEDLPSNGGMGGSVSSGAGNDPPPASAGSFSDAGGHGGGGAQGRGGESPSPPGGNSGDAGQGQAGGGSAGAAAGGSGGNAGAGGSTSEEPECAPLPTGSIAGFDVGYESESPMSPAVNIGSQIFLRNTGTQSIDLAELRLRYYLTNEVGTAVEKRINWGWARATDGTSTVDVMPDLSYKLITASCQRPTATSYLEFRFAASAGTLDPGFYIQFSWVLVNDTPVSFVQTNDYSFSASQKGDAGYDRLVALYGTKRVHGTEP